MATLKAREILSASWLYLGWALVSAVLLTAAALIDPFVLGFLFYATAAVSGTLALIALLMAPRRIPLALLGAVPTMLAMLKLLVTKWVY